MGWLLITIGIGVMAAVGTLGAPPGSGERAAASGSNLDDLSLRPTDKKTDDRPKPPQARIQKEPSPQFSKLPESLEKQPSSTLAPQVSSTTSPPKNRGKLEEVPWLPLIILTFLITTACTFCKIVRCQTCDSCPMFEHRSEANNRYGSARDTDVMRSLNKRFRATEGYPDHPAVDPFQKYIGNQRLRRYREPNVCIVDDKDVIIADTQDIYDSIHNSTYIKSNGSNDDIRKYKFDLEEKRRKNVERQEMIERTKTTAHQGCIGFSIYSQDQLMTMSKRNTANDLEAISENIDESRLALQLEHENLPAAPAYTSHENIPNIFNYWKHKSVHAPPDDDLQSTADAWSIHAPSLNTSEITSSQADLETSAHPETSLEATTLQATSFQCHVTPPEDEITLVECSSSKSKH